MLTIKIATSLSMTRYLQLCESGKTRKLKNAGDAQWGALMYSARVPSRAIAGALLEPSTLLEEVPERSPRWGATWSALG